MKQKILFLTVLLIAAVALFATTGCEGKQEANDDFWLVSDAFFNGYGQKVFIVYVKSGDNLYSASDGTDPGAYEKYSLGLDMRESYGVTGVYLPLGYLKGTHGMPLAVLSYGDIAPVVLHKKDELYSNTEKEYLVFYPATFVGYKDYATAMEEYGEVSDDFDNIPECRVYTIDSTDGIKVPKLETTAEGTVYDTHLLGKGYYFIDKSYGIIEIK